MSIKDIKDFYIGKYIKVTKLESLNDHSKNNYHTNTVTGEKWWCEGYVAYFDKLLYIDRIRNYNYPNGRFGYFHTSKIESIEEKDGLLILKTQNSEYEVKEVEEFKVKFNIVN